MTMSEHMKPLAPGEIRQYTVGNRRFQVMHVAGGLFTQAGYRDTDGEGAVLATDRFESVAVRAYVDAIEQAESDRIDALDDADGSAFIDSASGELIEPDSAPALKVDMAIAELQRFEEEDRAAVARGESANWWERGASTPAPTLADEVAALRNELLDLRDDLKTLRAHATDVPLTCRRVEDLSLAMVQRLDRIASALSRRATDAQCPGLPLPVGDMVPQCGHFAAHHPHRIGESVRYRHSGDSA